MSIINFPGNRKELEHLKISESEKKAQYITSVMEKTAKSLSLSYDSYTSPINYKGPIVL